MLAVVEPVVRAERAQERLLECVVRPLTAEPAPKQLAAPLLRAPRRTSRREGSLPRSPSSCETRRPAGEDVVRAQLVHTSVMRVAVVGHVEWIRFARVDRVPVPGEIAHSFDGLGAGGWWRRGRRRPAGAARGRGAPLHGARRRRAGPPRAGGARSPRRGRPRRQPTRGRSGGRLPRSTSGPNGRSRPSARSCDRAATTRRCPGTSSPRWTRCSSSRATSTP